MLVKQITYTDFNGDERTETFYFNLSRAEVLEMEIKHPGGYAEYLQRLVDSKNREELLSVFKTLILNSYGEKSEDGKHFRKDPELSKAFEQSEAYSELFVELISSAEAASAFVNGIMPTMNLSEAEKAEVAAKTKALIDAQS